MKRIFDLEYEDFFRIRGRALLEVIKASEGRTIQAETIISVPPFLEDISNPETAAAFGADMITLNLFDITAPFIFGYDDRGSSGQSLSQRLSRIMTQAGANAGNSHYIQDFKRMLGRFVGVNLEPVPEGVVYPGGYMLSEANLQICKALDFDYLVITANPRTGVSENDIVEGIKRARRVLGAESVIIAGKMHGAGAREAFATEPVEAYIEAGADILLTPAPGTVPGVTLERVKRLIDTAHDYGALAMTTIGTSQEGARTGVIEHMGIASKMAGADIQHIGDAGVSGMALPENILALSTAIRGVRHTYRRMARSSRRG